MKNIIKLISLFVLTTFMVIACNEDDYNFVQESNSDLVLLAPTVSNIIIDMDTPDAEAINIAWDDNANAGAPYTVEAAIDEMFTTPLPLGTSDSQMFVMSMSELNDALNTLGINPFEGSPIFVRVVSGTASSNVVSFNVTTTPVESPVITAPADGDTFTADQNTVDDVITTVTWDDFDNSTSGTTVVYELQAAAAGTDFASPVSGGTVTSTSPDMNSIELTHAELNSLALAAGIAGGSTGDIDLRIMATIETTSGSQIIRYSDPITLTVTTYSIDYPNLYFVGSASPDGWNNNSNNTPVFRDPNDPSVFHFTGYFNAGSFKLLEVLGQWQPQWGSNDGGSTLAVNDGTGSDPGTIDVATAGYYSYTFDFAGDTGTISVTPYDATMSTNYPTMEIIGDAIGGWGTGIPMTALASDPHIWYANGITFASGPFKFRTDNTWAHNWGVNSSELYGTANYGAGDNMTATAGTYNVWFNDLDGSYILIAN